MTAAPLKPKQATRGSAVSEKLERDADEREAAAVATEIQTSDGRSAQGRDAADAAANYDLQLHLVHRAKRGRSPLIADMLGFFEGDAAIARAR